MRTFGKLRHLMARTLTGTFSVLPQTSQTEAVGDLPEDELASDFSIKDLLLRDFDFDLPISGTFPNIGLRTNPIIIHSSDLAKIVETMYLTVHGMNMGLGLSMASGTKARPPIGVLWQPYAGRWIEYHSKEDLYSFTFERKRLAENGLDVEISRYFFKLPDANGSFAPMLERIDFPSITFGVTRLPRAIGSLHYNAAKSVDYGKQHGEPNLGFHFYYSALGIKASVYEYPIPAGTEEGQKALQLAFEQSASEVEAAMKDIANVPVLEDGSCFKERAWMVGSNSERSTVLGITIVRGHFLKYRVTWTRKKVLDQAVFEFISVLKNIVLN